MLIKILPDYVNHLKMNPYSLIAKIFAVFTIKVASMSPVRVMLMENTVRAISLTNIQNVFDLKGSTVDRLSANDAATLKDMNWRYEGAKSDFFMLTRFSVQTLRNRL